MATFMKVTKRINSNLVGVVTGSEWTNEKNPKAYLGFEEAGKILFGLMTKINKNKLMIYNVGIEDYVFGKEDVIKITIVEENAVANVGSLRFNGPKYKFDFKDGKSAFVCVNNADSYKIEKIID